VTGDGHAADHNRDRHWTALLSNNFAAIDTSLAKELPMVPGDAEEWSAFEITPHAAESAMGDAAAAAPASG
jgi:hypothetical protein